GTPPQPRPAAAAPAGSCRCPRARTASARASGAATDVARRVRVLGRRRYSVPRADGPGSRPRQFPLGAGNTLSVNLRGRFPGGTRQVMQSRPRSNRRHRDLVDRRGGLPSLPEALLAATILRPGTARTSPRLQGMRPALRLASYGLCSPLCILPPHYAYLASHPSLLHAEYRAQV